MNEKAGSTRASQLWFTAPGSVELREATLAAPAPEEVLVKTRYSAVSTGTELLAYRGQLPRSMSLDSDLESLQQSSDYPFQYGYTCVGEVQDIGSAVDPAWQGRRVFSFQPHASHFLAHPHDLKVLPDDVSAQAAAFLPNMETAVNLVQDGAPLIGERVVVVGQGIVGLLVTALLAQHPLASLVAVETRPERQALARRVGAHAVIGPDEAAGQTGDADLIYEVSGQPDALNLAISLSGYASRIVIGSWYGDKAVPLALGGQAHRNRLQLITSQVSTVAPALAGRWNKQRRFDLSWEMIRRVDPTPLITHTVPIQEAETLYRQLHEETPGIVQALFHYPH